MCTFVRPSLQVAETPVNVARFLGHGATVTAEMKGSVFDYMTRNFIFFADFPSQMSTHETEETPTNDDSDLLGRVTHEVNSN